MSVLPISPLVSAEWLAERLHDENVVVLDGSFFLPAQQRDAHAEYLAEHIPGAGFFDIDAIADTYNPLPHMLPSAREFAEAVGRLGVGPDTRVIAYDNNSFMASARVWWTFRVFGHERAAVLDGGLARWKRLGLPVESGPVEKQARAFVAGFQPELVRGLEDIRAWLQAPSAQLVDARAPGRFAGVEPEPRPGLRSGHIPGSRNLFFKRLVDEATHCLQGPDALEREFCQAGIDPTQPVICTCGTGVTASVLALGLYCIGQTRAAVYDGSWTEWGGREDVPVRVGMAP